MNREIKFRAFFKGDRHTKRGMYVVENINFITPHEVDIDDRSVLIEEVELMQFTGLKDKNGKEIYENDIVLNTFRGTKQILKCVWKDYGFAFVDKFGVEMWLTNVEVIDNIHDNPQLLEEEGK